MKHLKSFNESLSIDPVLSELKKKYGSDLKFKEKDGLLSFELDICPIEPELGSYVERSYFTGFIKKDGEGYSLKMDGISGSYGWLLGYSDEEEDEDWEPELDWTAQSSSHEIHENDLSGDQLISKFNNMVQSLS